MTNEQNQEITTGDVVFSKADEEFKLPMIVKHMPTINSEDVTCVWIGSQKNQVHGTFPIQALMKKPKK